MQLFGVVGDLVGVFIKLLLIFWNVLAFVWIRDREAVTLLVKNNKQTLCKTQD